MQEKNHTFVEIGLRLEIERGRLRMKHADFAKAGGVAPSTYSNYSSGEREPKLSFLAAISEIGADLLYIVTGERSGVARSSAAPTPAARAAAAIVGMNLNDADAEMLMALAKRLAVD